MKNIFFILCIIISSILFYILIYTHKKIDENWRVLFDDTTDECKIWQTKI